VPIAPEVSVSDQPVLPAKLLKAVQPIYPPEAMRNYITGDVRIEADVDKQGHIGAMKILLGPKQFRQVAMDALKQYEYTPATQGGKPVASKVTVTIKFWFDP
jgi:TonB family protein